MQSARLPLARPRQPQLLFFLLVLFAVVPVYLMAGDHDGHDHEKDVSPDYPPYGSNVPTAHFDHEVRPDLTPPPVKLLSDGSGRVAQSSWNMELVGYDTLDGRTTYQPLVAKQLVPGRGVRYIAYMAHHAGPGAGANLSGVNRLNGKVEINGTSILDVTDPHHPVYLAHIPGFPGSIDSGGNQMAHVCAGDRLPSNSRAEADRKAGHYYLLRSNGNSSGSANPGTESHEIYDVTNPAAPTLLTTLPPGSTYTNTHKSWWECDSGVAYLVANDSSKAAPYTGWAPGWQQSGSNQHVKIYNLHDPANPEYIRDFGFPGQQPTAVGPATQGLVTPPTGIHGPISTAQKNRVYMAYGVGSDGVVEIVNRDKLLKGCTLSTASANCATSPTASEMTDPEIVSFTIPGGILQGGHTSMPIFGEEDGRPRNILEVTSEEGGNECSAASAPHALWLYDITDEKNPVQISQDANDPANTRLDVPNGFDFSWTFAPHTFAVGVYPTSLTPTDNAANPNSFCNEGGRFGIHAVTELFYPAFYGKVAIASWFTGGVRVFDIRNPDHARPIAYFVPAPNGPYSPPYTVPNTCGSAGGPSAGPGCTFLNAGRGVAISAFSINNNVVTFTANNNFTAGEYVSISGLSKGTYLNGWTFQVQTASSTQFTAAVPAFPVNYPPTLIFSEPNVGTTADSGTASHGVFNIHTNNPELDDRGYIYLADRAGTGMHILKLTGEAARAVSGDDDHGHHDH